MTEEQKKELEEGIIRLIGDIKQECDKHKAVKAYVHNKQIKELISPFVPENCTVRVNQRVDNDHIRIDVVD